MFSTAILVQASARMAVQSSSNNFNVKDELIATDSSDGKLRLIDAATGDAEREISNRDAFLRHPDLVAFHPHGDLVANVSMAKPQRTPASCETIGIVRATASAI